jgi:methylated-DNA-[protein]-cysteine S-methyltransferase
MIVQLYSKLLSKKAIIFFMMKIKYIRTNLGEMILGEHDGRVCLCDWRHRSSRSSIDRRMEKYFADVFHEKPSAILDDLESQINQYIGGERQNFDIDFEVAGTEFQQKVWSALQTIPYGRTLSYKELALNVGDDKAFRAVANANGANALSLIIPCHRVIASDGSLGGYAGGIEAKRDLLTLEGSL